MDAINRFMADRFGAEVVRFIGGDVWAYETKHARFLVELNDNGGGVVYSFVASIPQETGK